MTSPTATPKVDRTIRLRDGRRMAYSEWGDLAGTPIVLLHGQPGSRLMCPDEEATRASRTRLITIDRPGYGLSDARPGAALLDWPSDFIELADQLDLGPCPVVGWSAGGKYALALGFRAPDRVTSIGLAASPGPKDQVPGALEELSAENQAVVELLRRERAAGLRAVSKACAWYAGDGWETMFADSWGDADDRLLAEPEVLAAMKTWLREGARQGPIGFADDLAASYSSWGFALTDIRQPVHVWVADSDVQVARRHGDYFAASIPRATLVTFARAGHLFPISHWGEMLAALGAVPTP
jgi:pimeloyl-ACP methyl ester carboxylesterase